MLYPGYATLSLFGVEVNPWIIEPVWQNYSSMYREAITAKEAKTGMELSHHLTSSLYFAISALEAFLNRKMRKHLSATHEEKKIYDRLRKGKITDKLKNWPEELLGKPLTLRSGTMDTIGFFNDVRGDLTHPKTTGHHTYKTLEQVDADSVIDVVAEYIAQYHQACGDQFHYWLWGWNYLNAGTPLPTTPPTTATTPKSPPASPRCKPRKRGRAQRLLS